jgi:hypothetical protein
MVLGDVALALIGQFDLAVQVGAWERGHLIGSGFSSASNSPILSRTNPCNDHRCSKSAIDLRRSRSFWLVQATAIDHQFNDLARQR